MKWILGAPKKDLWLILPGVFGVALMAGLPMAAGTAALLFFTFAFVDSGHVYTTILRTHIQNPDRKNFWYLNSISFGIFVAIAAWCYVGGAGLWKFITYATLFHHIRQHYGVSRWYHGINHSSPTKRHYPLLYGLWTLSMIAFHFRPMGGTTDEILYSKNDFWLNPNPTIYSWVVSAYLTLFILWSVNSAFAIRKNSSHMPGTIYELSSLITYAWAGFFAPNFILAAIPMFFSHGIPYIALIADSATRTRPGLFKNIKIAASASVLVALVFGFTEWFAEGQLIEQHFEANMLQLGLGPSLLIGAYLTPLLSHYIYDAIIWRRKYSESHAVYKSQPTPDELKAA